jgi:PEP-CTERM motif-containing protein
MKNTKSALGTWFIAMTVVCLLHLAAPARAAADVVVIVTGTFSDGSFFLPSSTITINTVTGVADASTIALSNGEQFFGAPTVADTDTEYEWQSTSPSGAYELQMIPLTTFDTVIGGGGTASSSIPNVGIYPYGNFMAIANSANTQFVAPEPSSVTLLGAGLLALVGMALRRKRFA